MSVIFASCLALICSFVAAVWVGRQRAAHRRSQGLVLLLGQAVSVSTQRLAAVVSSEICAGVEALEDDGEVPRSTRFVLRTHPSHFAISLNGTLYAFRSVARRYGVNGVGEHQAWIAIYLLDPKVPATAHYRLMGRLLSHFAESAAVAVYHPPSRRLVPFTADTGVSLRATDPLPAVFGELPGLLVA